MRGAIAMPLALAAFLLSGCSGPANETAEAVARPARVYQVEAPSSSAMRRFPAQVQAAERAPLAFRVAGELMALPVKAGQDVAQGAVLARLDPSDYQLQVDDRKARYELAESQFTRIRDLYEQSQISKAQFDQAKAELDISKAAYTSARTDLSYTVLKAPFSGIVAEVFADNHQPVAAGKTVLVMQARDQLEIRMQIPENLMAHIARRENVDYQPLVEFEAITGRQFPARYKEHTAQADAATGSFTVTLTMPRPQGLNVLPGMSASVYVDLNQVLSQQTSTVFVPAQAVFQNDEQPGGTNQAQVWVVGADMTLSARAVETGEISSLGLEILSGLQPGETVLAAGVHQASAGMRIRPWIKERGL
ncbi:efflux RND transporter periplasmic adaptor subunit [Thalassolituus sp. LLYu03]|uniref:efflux RND transporter periplasmic adaptor subunit n=1 Tax=Thalassolituus sp. LLYu03 TaxID=3421656 RepID=UPI003D290CA4